MEICSFGRRFAKPANSRSCARTHAVQSHGNNLLARFSTRDHGSQGCTAEHVSSAQQTPISAYGSKPMAVLASTILACCVCLLPVGPAEAGTPFTDAAELTGGLQQGRIQACPGAVNPNCISTSSTNTMYAAPWRSTSSSLQAALQDLDSAVIGGFPGARKLQSREAATGWYVAYNVKGRFDKADLVEFLIKTEGITNRNWEGDRDGPAVFYRSIAGDVKYIWPLQQPVSDLDTQKKRMKTLRQQLQWPLVGCELIECYEEDFFSGF